MKGIIRNIFLTATLSAILAGAAIWFATASSAQSNDTAEVTTAAVNNQPQQANPAKFDGLIEKARKNGAVRVIVGLKVDNFKPESELNSEGASAQRAAISQAQSNLLEKLGANGVSSVKQFEFIPFMALQANDEALATMKNLAEVTGIEEDELSAPTMEQSIPLVGADRAWQVGFGGQGRAVAVLDTGVDKNHPFLAGKVVSEACYSTNDTTNNSQSVCPGGAPESTASNSGLHCNMNLADGCSHGTHVAGTVAGRSTALNRFGVAKDASIIAMQVFSMFNNTQLCGGNSTCALSYTSDQIKALERVYALRNSFAIDAVNMSLGGGQFTSNCDGDAVAQKAIIDTLRSANIATIIASGNNGYTNAISRPACISSAISVGSTLDGDTGTPDTVSSFSNSASFLTILAPGERILSSVPGGGYEDQQGTSMATPHVAGAWAVMKHKYPNETVSQILNRLVSTGKPITDSRNGITKNRIRVDHAIGNPRPDACLTVTPINYNQPVNATLTADDCNVGGKYRDYYSFSGTAGQAIVISQSSGAFDTYLRLYDANNNLIAENDDIVIGINTNSRIPIEGTFILPSTGNFIIDASSYSSGSTGSYTVGLQGTAPTCNYSLNPNSLNIGAAGGAGSFNVSTQGGCAWQAVSNMAWTTTSSNGSGAGTINYTIAPNTTAQQRFAQITVGDQNFLITQSGATQQPRRALYDFDGDGKSDVSVFRPSNGGWHLNRSTQGYSGLSFGVATDIPAAADFDGDGKTDVAVFRPSNGTWYVMGSTVGFYGTGFGANGDVPVPADYDGDGKADVAVFRPSNGSWYIMQSSNSQVLAVAFGANGDKPQPADYDADGKADVAVFRASNGTWYLNRSTAGFTGIAFGANGDKPFAADFDGDNRADVAVFRPSNGTWYLMQSTAGIAGISFGASTDVPAAGDYDGDGKADVAVFRPSNGSWYLNRSQAGFTAVGFGTTGDKPVPGGNVQ